MGTSESYSVTVLSDVNDTQDIDDRAEARSYIVSDHKSGTVVVDDADRFLFEREGLPVGDTCIHGHVTP